MCTCINEGYDDERKAMAQIYNYDFRQFCRNWSVEEVAQAAEARDRGTRWSTSFTASKIEKLIAAYFISDGLISEEGPTTKTFEQMEKLINYRTKKFVMNLFNSYDRQMDFFKHDPLAIANHAAIAVVEDWEAGLEAQTELSSENDDSDGNKESLL